MSGRDELIEMLSFAEQLHAEDYRPEHGADAVRVWLGEQFDAEMREAVALRLSNADGTFDATDPRGEFSEWHALAAAALAVVLGRLELDGGAPDTQEGARRKAGCGQCLACDPPPRGLMRRMYACVTCGNKRCPASSNCAKWECSGSNDPKQIPVLKESR